MNLSIQALQLVQLCAILTILWLKALAKQAGFVLKRHTILIMVLLLGKEEIAFSVLGRWKEEN